LTCFFIHINRSPAIALTTEQVKVSQVWVREFYKAFDAFYLNYWFTKFYTPDTVLNLRNRSSMKGYDEILEHLEKEKSLLT
jgi:hypothetical protein